MVICNAVSIILLIQHGMLQYETQVGIFLVERERDKSQRRQDDGGAEHHDTEQSPLKARLIIVTYPH